MSYCLGCGSEVTDDTNFCPYCGINIQQQTTAENGGNSLRENITDVPVTLGVETTLSEADAQSSKEIVENQNGNSGNLIDSIDENKFIDNESKITVADEPVFVSSEGENIEDLYAQNESNLMSYEESEIQENLSVEERAEDPTAILNNQIESVLNEKVSELAESNASHAKSSAPSDFLSHEGLDSTNVDKEFEADKEIGHLSGQSGRTLENNFEKPISKPDTKLEAANSNCPSPRFDSVRIMEKPAGENSENMSSANSADEDSVLVVQNSHATHLERSDAERSLTAPNIAGSETAGRKSAKLKPLDEGTVLNNRYEIVRKIGGGGMGAVYLASDKNLGGVLRAVKEMVQSYIEDAAQEKAISDFKRESLLLTSLEHQSIPTIYDYFFEEKEARFYLVMKYISGGDLASRLRSAPENRIEERVVTEWAIQIADVLDYLHNRQPAIIYRDLKPANIMIDGNTNRVMLIDFGIARWVNKEEKGVTAVGTMGYAPPELFSGNVEPRSDIYSLGSTLFHLLTGADPQSNPLLIFDFQKHPRPRQINSQISDQMEKILMQMVEYNADQRFASASDVRESLERHLVNLKANNITYGVKETPSPAAFSDQPVFCGFCGQKIVATDMFCAFCGAKQPLAQKGVQSQSYQPTRNTAQLLIVGTNDLQTPSFRLEKDENLLGRRDPMSNIFPEVDLSKFDPQTKISRKHARIWREGTNFLVEDLGSSNGTIILSAVKENVRLLPRQPFTLSNGDKIKLGDTTLHFVVA